MSRFISENRVAQAAKTYFALLAASAFGFYILQNHVGIIGGEIALSKLVWLAYAITLWLALPLLISLDSRTPPSLRHCFQYLSWMMLARGIIELWMLYVSRNWSPFYGLGHDIVCMAGLILLLARARRIGDLTDSHARTLWRHGVLTALVFLPEMYFAWYMRTHFNTEGGQAVYFVPDTEAHRRVLFITGSVDILLTLYFPVFLHRWFHVNTDRRNR